MLADSLNRMLEELDRLSASLAAVKDRNAGGDDLCHASRTAMALASKATVIARDAVLLSAQLEIMGKRNKG